jgi:hypothetical protein
MYLVCLRLDPVCRIDLGEDGGADARSHKYDGILLKRYIHGHANVDRTRFCRLKLHCSPLLVYIDMYQTISK